MLLGSQYFFSYYWLTSEKVLRNNFLDISLGRCLFRGEKNSFHSGRLNDSLGNKD